MQSQIEKTNSNLGELAVMSRQTEAAERKILESATKRLADVQSELNSTRGSSMLSKFGADKYQELVLERGQLQQVIAKSHSVLTP